MESLSRIKIIFSYYAGKLIFFLPMENVGIVNSLANGINSWKIPNAQHGC